MRNDFCPGYLEHSAKGKTWANHRYIAKVKLASGKWFYFYDAKAYQNYLNKSKEPGRYAKANPDKELVEEQAKSDPTLKKLISSGVKGKTTEEKTKNLKTSIKNGEKKIQELLSKDSKSKKKGKGSSSKKSKSDISTKKFKPAKAAKDKASKKAAAGASKKAKAEPKAKADKQAKKTEEKKQSTRVFNTDSLKKMFGMKDEDIRTHEDTSKLLDKLKSYDEDSYGYILAGDKVYKWSKSDGQITFMDYDTDKEVTISSALKDIQEFRIDKKKK
ncbi:hypothetical protein [Butyrivibrio sp. INlla21]|uniref:hypothetical protein n=1 Tax=Butyrivibrio sp. INlla21 TaxID=1520811 RepID=UPI0008DF7C70|nr:hypothetical protein [Butyrivibrio sp. INlla21]SFU33302.1 hypothetical protein SAMN02910342_00115 [Butyrivibrio sp. INlla21]